MIVTLFHHYENDELKKKIEEKCGSAPVEIRENGEGILEIEFNERESPWRHTFEIQRFIEQLKEENEEIYAEKCV